MYDNSSTQNTHRTSAWPRKSGSVVHVNLQKGHHYTYVTMAGRVRGLWKINVRPRQDLHSFRICGFQFVLNIKASYIFSLCLEESQKLWLLIHNYKFPFPSIFFWKESHNSNITTLGASGAITTMQPSNEAYLPQEVRRVHCAPPVTYLCTSVQIIPQQFISKKNGKPNPTPRGEGHNLLVTGYTQIGK